MPTQLYPRPFAIRQLCTAGAQFTGAAPGTVPVWAADVYAFPTSATAGLIDPGAFDYRDRGGVALCVLGVEFAPAGTALQTWTISKVDGAGNETVWLSGTVETSVLASHPDTPRLLPGEMLRVATTGAAAAQVVQVTFAPWEV